MFKKNNYFFLVLLFTFFAFLSIFQNSIFAADYSYTGTVQTFTVPQWGQYRLEVWGAQGGADGGYAGANGGYASGYRYLTKGQVLYIYVGGMGYTGAGDGAGSSGCGWGGGYNGGGGAGARGYSGGGGGASDIRLNAASLYDRIIVAGGGGGSGAESVGRQPGYGGGLNGTNGFNSTTNGASQTGYGTSGYGNGQFGIGATHCDDGGGGGGGYFGGGAGNGDHYGGGGSGYIGGVSDGYTVNNAWTGNGYARITLVMADNVAPVCGTWTPTSSAWKNAGTSTFTLSSSTDALSGISKSGGICTTGSANGATCTITISDIAGNTRICTSPANKIDASSPIADSITGYQTLSTASGGTVPITISGMSDALSGLANLQLAYFVPGASNWTYYTVANSASSYTFYIPVTIEGTYYVAIAVQDKAGNWSNFSGDNYKRTSFTISRCTKADGVCQIGEYTTASAAAGSATCKYGYTSYATTNATCGGSNITCYKRLNVYTNILNGSCQTGEQSFNCSTSQILVNQYITTNATCGGNNITCYQCSNYTCSRVNLDETGKPDCRYCFNKNDDQCLNFPASTPTPNPNDICTTTPNQNDENKCVVIINSDSSKSLSCIRMNSSNPYIYIQGNNSGDNTINYRPIACSEFGENYTTADKCLNNQLPIPIENFCDGDSYFNGVASQCVTCLDAAAPWFQVVNGNIYAKGSIESEVDLSEVPVMRNSDPICSTNSASLSGVGVPVAGDKVLNITSQNNNGVIANFANGFANIDPEDYSFFARYFGYSTQELIDPENVKRCPSNLNSNDNSFYTPKDAFICLIKSENNFQTKLSDFLPETNETENLETPLLIPAGVKKVIFVSGDILLDREIILAPKNENQEQGFFMLIASGNIEVSSYLGDFLTETNFSSIGGSCAYQSPALHGIFIANGTINFSSGGTNNAFNNSAVNRNCDKKITVKGSFIGWGKNNDNHSGILMSRTFLGCVPGSFADSEVPIYTNYNLNYNGRTPVLTFIYDADLLNRLPNWINKAVWSRFEVN